MSTKNKRLGEKIKRHEEIKKPKILKKGQTKTPSEEVGNTKKDPKLISKVSGAKSKSKSDTKLIDESNGKSPYFAKTDVEEQASVVDISEASDEGPEKTLAEDSGQESEGSDQELKTSSEHTGRLKKSFFEKSCESLAKDLLGKVLVRIHNGERLTGRIIETEAYLGKRDKAAHSYKGKTDRNAAMFMDPGTSYVYNIYGMYCCMNISSQGEGEAVLIRSLEPVEGKPTMSSFRISNRKNTTSGKPMKDRDLCNGPSKLTQALNINKVAINQVDLTTSDVIWLEDGEVAVPVSKMVVSKRINIAYAEEWTDKPLRFYELGNPCVSVKDKEMEKAMEQAKS